jgi:hypothetical protein
MNTKTAAAGVLGLVIIAGVGYYALQSSAAPAAGSGTPGPTANMRIGGNAVVVMEQRPGAAVKVNTAYFEEPGFVVIHADEDGQPGPVLGSSGLLPKGEISGLNITLSRSSKDGEKLHAMLHADTDGDGAFSSADAPLKGGNGEAIDGWFDISVSASENMPVTI